MPLDLLPIPLLPTPPSKTDPANFAERADIFLEALPDFCTDTNSTIATLNLITSGLDQATPIAAYNAGTTYDFPDVCAGTDGYTYRCISTGVIGDDPVGSVTLNWVKVGGGGGLAWSVETTDKTTIPGRGYMMDNSSSAHTVTLHTSPKLGDSIAVGDLNGNFAINNCTIDRNSMLIHGVAEDMILDVKNQRCTLTYTGVTDGWVVTELEPNNSQFEYMPYAVMHVREEQPSGTAGGTSTSTTTHTRVLNIVKKNEIAGASLGSNQITLPAGEYSIEVICPSNGSVGLNKSRLYNVTASSYILEGSSESPGGGQSFINGAFTLTTQSVFEVRHYITTGIATTGLGNAISQGTEVYTDVVITKIGGNYAPRLITTDAQLQMVAGLDYTGNVLGFDVTKTGATQLTIKPGTCKNHDGTVDLYTTANTVITDAVSANTTYHFAVVKLNNGTMTVKRYLSEAAMAADVGVNITHFRWIGEWRSNGSSNYVLAIMVNGVMIRGKASECVISSNVVSTYATVDHTTQMTPSRVEAIEYGVYDATEAVGVYASMDGTDIEFTLASIAAGAGDTNTNAWGTENSHIQGLVPFTTSRQFKASGTISLLVHQIKYRR